MKTKPVLVMIHVKVTGRKKDAVQVTDGTRIAWIADKHIEGQSDIWSQCRPGTTGRVVINLAYAKLLEFV